MTPIEEGLDLTLNHFQEPIWPRAISTKTTQCRQILVYNRDEALARFKQSKYLDCRISAYGQNADKNPSAVARFQGIMTATPTDLMVMMDLDRCNFKSERALGLALAATLKNIKEKLIVNTPTVLWSGRGYHIIQPLDANGIVFEHIRQFENVHQPTIMFLRFAERFLSSGKSDSQHNNTVSFGNMMLRIPGSINSKNEQEVRLVHKWDGKRPQINYLLRDFRHWLIDQRVKKIYRQTKQELRANRGTKFPVGSNSKALSWIEKLLHTPIHDYRKMSIWRILAPYLVNVKKLSKEDAFNIMNNWLEECNKLERLNFNSKLKVMEALNGAAKGYFPIGFEKMKIENNSLHNLLQNRRGLTR